MPVEAVLPRRPEKEPEEEGPPKVLPVGALHTVAPRSFILIGLFLLVLFHTLRVARDLFLPLILAFPLVLGRRLTLNPVVIFGGLLFWFFLWGVPGALLTVPILAIFKIVCDHLDTLAPIASSSAPPKNGAHPIPSARRWAGCSGSLYFLPRFGSR